MAAAARCAASNVSRRSRSTTPRPLLRRGTETYGLARPVALVLFQPRLLELDAPRSRLKTTERSPSQRQRAGDISAPFHGRQPCEPDAACVWFICLSAASLTPLCGMARPLQPCQERMMASIVAAAPSTFDLHDHDITSCSRRALERAASAGTCAASTTCAVTLEAGPMVLARTRKPSAL
jgi:hypothetical protein